MGLYGVSPNVDVRQCQPKHVQRTQFNSLGLPETFPEDVDGHGTTGTRRMTKLRITGPSRGAGGAVSFFSCDSVRSNSLGICGRIF